MVKTGLTLNWQTSFWETYTRSVSTINLILAFKLQRTCHIGLWTIVCLQYKILRMKNNVYLTGIKESMGLLVSGSIYFKLRTCNHPVGIKPLINPYVKNSASLERLDTILLNSVSVSYKISIWKKINVFFIICSVESTNLKTMPKCLDI